jgi:hypothetical protein
MSKCGDIVQKQADFWLILGAVFETRPKNHAQELSQKSDRPDFLKFCPLSNGGLEFSITSKNDVTPVSPKTD